MHYLQLLVFWRRLGDIKAAREWLTRVRLLAYQSAALCETTQSEGVYGIGGAPSTEHDLNYMADIQNDSPPGVSWSSSSTVTSQRMPFKVDPRRERWEPEEWEVDVHGWIRRRKDEDVGMYSLANEWMGKWRIRRLGFEDRTPELLKSQESSRSRGSKPPFEKLGQDRTGRI